VNRTFAPTLAAAPTLRLIVSPNTMAALLGFLLVAPLAASDGGYWPTAWGWTAFGLCWIALVALFVRERIRFASAELLFLGLIATLFAWVLISVLWTSSVGRTVFEAERMLMYLVAILAAFLLVRTRSYRALLGGVWAAIVLVCMYALATRLFPERLGVFDPVAGYRLSEPIGYWNGLGLFACIGSLLAFGLAARSRVRIVRPIAASSLLVTLPTMFFTFSRGTWIALGISLAAAIALDPRRLQLVGSALALAPAPAVALALAYRSEALTHPEASLAAASHQGHRLVLILLVLAGVNALVALALELAERRVTISTAVRRTFGVALAVILIAALTFVFVRYGSPVTLAKRGYADFSKPTTRTTDLNQRLFTFSSRGRFLAWKAAWADFEDHRRLGSGAGTYELYWARHRPVPTKVRDAHSLYLETLAELGPVGVLLLGGGLLVPVAAAIRARRSALAPAAFGAYVAFLVHAGIDWDWELTAITIAALFCGMALLLAAREGPVSQLSRPSRAALVAALLVLAAASFVAAIGNAAIADGKTAAEAGDPTKAEADARKAMRWMPWASEPWQLAGEAQVARGDLADARSTLRTAIAKDPNDWELWLDLSLASRGRARRVAAARAVRLNPLGPELASSRKLLGLDKAP
jgi:tetratricopeptide (TPR) repeat protein